ncbi:hypothetical protein RBB50_000445 [Rhinocladiella similis]
MFLIFSPNESRATIASATRLLEQFNQDIELGETSVAGSTMLFFTIPRSVSAFEGQSVRGPLPPTAIHD